MEHQALLTLVVAASLGVLLIIAAERLRIPGIVLLLIGGIAIGPEGFGVIDPNSLGGGLPIVIELAVAVILFEGGLTLDIRGYRRASTVIRRMLTAGVVITWLGTSLLVWALLPWSFSMSLLAGSLVIVTGPTVISPLLRRMRISERVHHALYWEGVLIDAVGVFVAVACFQWLETAAAGAVSAGSLFGPIGLFALRTLLGLGIGLVAGLLISEVMLRKLIADEHVNIFSLVVALLAFGVSHILLPQSGILTVVVAGLVVALRKPAQLKKMKTFKLELTELGIGLLFVLLAAKLQLGRFAELGAPLLLHLAGVVFLLRPINVFVATWGQGWTLAERGFMSWIAPRGIVAASMASLFAIALTKEGVEGAVHLETITYAVIICTVALQGLTAPTLARLLRLTKRPRHTWLLSGGPTIIRALGRAFRRAGASAVTLVHTDDGPIGDNEDATSTTLITLPVDDVEDPRFSNIAAVLLAHDHDIGNASILAHWTPIVGDDRCYQWVGPSAAMSTETDAAEDPAAEAGAIRDPPARLPSVWPSLPPPAEIAHGIETKDLSITVISLDAEDDERRFGRDLRPLFWVTGESAAIVPDPDKPGRPAGELAIVLKRRVNGLDDLIVDVEIIDNRSPTMREVVLQLLREVSVRHPSLGASAVLDDIVGRETTMSTAVGGGVAIPHTRLAGVDRPECYLAVLPQGLDTPGPDGKPVHFVCFVISPPDQARAHLQSLAALVDLFSDVRFVELLRHQRTPARVSRLIAERA